MNVHEYQAKSLLREFGVPVPEGRLATTPEEAEKAARALGSSNASIMLRHVLPNAMVATLTFLPFILAGSITLLTSLDFLGLGLPIGSASLGEVLVQGRISLHAPWIGISAVVTLASLLSVLIFASEAARDAFDPRKTFG